MKRKKLSAFGIAVVLAGAALIPALTQTQTEGAYTPRGEESLVLNKWSGAAELYRLLHADVATGEVNPELIRKVAKEARKFNATKQKSTLGLQWIEKGPDNVGGRTRAITVDINNTNKIYAGSVSGGLFVSLNRGNTWSQVMGFNENTAIGCMDMLGNGTLVIGTGSAHEGFATGSGGSEFRGNGIYYSTDGVNFQHVQNESGTNLDFFNGYNAVSEMVADPNDDNSVWVGSSNGLEKINVVTGAITTPAGLPSTVGCEDVSLSANGQVMLAVFGSNVYRSTDGGANFTRISDSTNPTALPRSGISRVETAISQDDANFMYALIAASSGQLLNAYGSSDGGDNWSIVMPGSSAPFNSLFGTGQGGYDNVISAVPGNPGECIIGGVTLWKSGVQSQPEQIALNFAPDTHPLYVHSDIHEFTWSPDGLLYIGCDGGVHISDDKAKTFYQANRFFNITQFYSSDFNGLDYVIGGSQDNGTQLIDGSGVTPQSAREVLGGDGFDCDFSTLNNDIVFASIYNGAINRSNGGGEGMGQFFDARVMAESNGSPLGAGLGGFYTTFGMYENENNPNAEQYILYVNEGEEVIPAQTTITVKSLNGDFPQSQTLSADLAPGDSVYIRDKVETMFCAGFGGGQGYWLTRQSHQFDITPEWIKISGVGGQARDIEFTADGNHMFYSDYSGEVYRVSNLNNVWSVDQGDVEIGTDVQTTISTVFSGSAVVTGIAMDPNDVDHVVISVGGYGTSTAHVLESFNATAASPTFNSIQGDLPAMPVYDAMIEKNDPSRIIVGTEYGVYSTTDGSTWTSENNGLPLVPVFEIEQQTSPSSARVMNEGTIYIGTHGRGIWKAENYTAVKEIAGKTENTLSLKVFPNPTTDVLNLDLSGLNGTTTVTFYNLAGKELMSVQKAAGLTQNIAVGDLLPGMYIVKANDGATTLTARFTIER